MVKYFFFFFREFQLRINTTVLYAICSVEEKDLLYRDEISDVEIGKTTCVERKQNGKTKYSVTR